MIAFLPPLAWLRAFEAAARHRSFVGAARELGVTPSAISQQVRLLEEKLGRPLFARLPRGIRLTEAGEAYSPVVQQAFDGLMRGTDALFGRLDRKGVHLRATASFQAHWLLPRIGQFLDRNPEVELRILTTLWASDLQGSNVVDLEICYGDGVWPGYEAHRLTEDRLQPYAAVDLLARIPHGDAGAWLGEQRLIELIGFREGWREWFAGQEGSALPALAGRVALLEVDSVATAFALAEAGRGVALLRSWMAQKAVAEGRLAALPQGRPLPASDCFYLLVPRTGRLPRTVVLLRDWILEEAGR